MGSIRFMFSLATNLVVASITIKAVASMGGGAAGWRNVAIVYGLIGLVVNTISVLSVKEVPDEEEKVQTSAEKGGEDKLSLWESAKLLFANKYYLIIVAVYVLTYIQTGIAGIGIYYMTYVFGNPALLGTFSAAQMFPMIVGLALTPALVKKAGSMYKVNLTGYCIAFFMRIGFIIGGLIGSIPMMLTFSVISGLCVSPVTGDLNALIAATSDYTYRTKGKRIDGTMFSCSSLGIKIGGGLGTALAGMLLEAGGYVANAPVQSASCINMLKFMYLGFPFITVIITAIILSRLKVEKANEDWDREHAVEKA